MAFRMSHPLRVCGLKQIWLQSRICKNLSHPLRVCGLKHIGNIRIGIVLSHTLYGCVDWNFREIRRNLTKPCHTLYGCVDWNTIMCQYYICFTRHTLYGCVDWNKVGEEILTINGLSHPLRVCGLKLLANLLLRMKDRVTPFTGVWIETFGNMQKSWLVESHTLYGCVDWNWPDTSTDRSWTSHTLYGCVDWNILVQSKQIPSCHTLYGCVDWNHIRGEEQFETIWSHPLRVCGLKHICMYYT